MCIFKDVILLLWLQAKPYDTESNPESCMIKDALRELEAIRFPTAARMQKQEELCTNLAEARLALKDKDIAWRYGRAPDYSKTREYFSKSKSTNDKLFLWRSCCVTDRDV